MRGVTKKASWFKAALVAGAAAAAMFSMSANAVLITQWKFDNYAGLRDPTSIGVVTLGPAATVPGFPTDVKSFTWGAGCAPCSSLVVGPDILGGIIDTIPILGVLTPGVGVTLTHNNFPINVPPQLTGGTLDDVLVLTPNLPAVGAPLPAFPVSFIFKFTETENDPVSGICVDGTLRSAPANSPDGCQDIFAITNPGGLNGSFNLDGINYDVAISVVGLGTLSPGACGAVGLGAGCQGFETRENFANVLNPSFTITATSVPEPGTLALVGLALAGIGFVGRRRMS